MGILCFQLKCIPDLSLNKYQSLADTGIEGVLKRHESFLRQWHGICMESSTSFHLLYAYMPSEPLAKRLKVYFLVQGEETSLQLVKPLLKKSPLSDFFDFCESKLPDVDFSNGATFIKKERMAEIYNPLTGNCKHVHYVPGWSVNNDARLYDLARIMEIVGQAYENNEACAYRVDLYPEYAVMDTRNCLSPVLKELRGENEIKLMKDSDSVKSNDYAKDICKEYEQWITDVETSPHFRVNIYAFAGDIFKAKVILNAVGSEAISQGDFSIAPIKPDEDGKFSLLSRMGRVADVYCFYPSQAKLASWSTTYSLSETVPFFRFPTLYEGENLEIPKETAPLQVDNGIHIGVDMNGYSVNFPLKDLPRHAFFTGMPGSGKTNTMLHFVTELRKNKIPFLALEPAKKEYRALLGYENMQDIFLFSPHLQSRFPLHINPMAFPEGVRLSEHINALLEVFEGSFTLEGPTYKFLSSAIEHAYSNLGWDIEDENDPENPLPYPCLQDVYDNLQKEIDESSYDAEMKGNVRAFLQVRLGSLMERDTGELFNVRFSTIKPDEWINHSAIVELEVLGEQAKNFFVLLVCHYILETLRVNPTDGVDEKGNKLPVRHVLFIEEAHNIIASSTRQAGADSVDPKIAATAYIVKMLAEVRALREAIVIADQLPTALAGEVTKNTGLKLVHRLTAQDDRAQIGAAISATPMQLERMASFTSGRAFIYHEKTKKTFEIQVDEWLPPKVEFDCTNDMQLYSQLWLTENLMTATKVSFRNWQYKYVLQADEKLASLQEQLKNADDYIDIQCCINQKELLLKECNKLKVKCDAYRRLWVFSDEATHPLIGEIEWISSYIDEMIKKLDLISEIGKELERNVIKNS